MPVPSVPPLCSPRCTRLPPAPPPAINDARHSNRTRRIRWDGRGRGYSNLATANHAAHQPRQRLVKLLIPSLPWYISKTLFPSGKTMPSLSRTPHSRQSPCPRHDHTRSKGNTCLRNRTYDTAPPHRRCRSQVLDVVPPVSRHSPTPKSVSLSQAIPPDVRALSQPIRTASALDSSNLLEGYFKFPLIKSRRDHHRFKT